MNIAVQSFDSEQDQIIKIAVLAIGGQGGGVLTNWIADLGTRCGYAVQMTSVAGVAQRTGATIYYVEMAPKSHRSPVFALSPSPGDVDILIAAELTEAGRAVMRGFVTPDQTTLIASNHRVLAISEKISPTDGSADANVVEAEIRRAAQNLICFDMDKIAHDAGSIISASLFGGLARSGALPFKIQDYEETIKSSGKGIDASLMAFRNTLNFDDVPRDTRKEKVMRVSGPIALRHEWEGLCKLVANYHEAVQPMLKAGLQKTVDYQDIAYGQTYLDYVQSISEIDLNPNKTLTITAAKYIANAMCYDDILRVADLKTRRARNARLIKEQGLTDNDLVQVTEYFHPRAQEVCSVMPKRLGTWVLRSPKIFRSINYMVNKGRRIRTDSVLGFGTLWLVSLARKHRRHLLRHRTEMEHVNTLKELALKTAKNNYNLAIEIIKCQRLIKGYSDTHSRGLSKFQRVIEASNLVKGRDDAAEWVARFRESALQDEKGDALEGAIQTVRQFVDNDGEKVGRKQT